MNAKHSAAVAGLAGCLLLCPWAGKAAVLLQDDFDDQPVGSGNPDDFIAFGAGLADRGITSLDAVSAPNSAYLSVNFDNGFAGMIRLPFSPYVTLSNISVAVRATSDLSSNLGMFGFQLVDADGTAARTQTGDLLSPSTAFQVFEQDASAINLITSPGSIAGLDTTRIVQFGFLVLDRGDLSGAASFYMDDLELEGWVIPEPGTIAFLLIGLGMMARLRHRTTPATA